MRYIWERTILEFYQIYEKFEKLYEMNSEE